MKHFRTETNPITGAQEDYYWDDAEQKLVQRTRTDVTAVLEANKRKANETIDGRKFGTGHMMHHVAEIPLSVVTKWKRELGVDVFSNDPWHKKRVKQLLNDPDWRFLKSTGARI